MAAASPSSPSLGRLGIWSSLDRTPAGDVIAFARLVDELGYDALWVNESSGREPFVVLGALVAVTERVTLGLGIASLYARDAAAAHAGARSLADLSGGRFVMGLGVSHRSSVTSRGHLYDPPLAAMATYLDAYDAAPYSGPALQAEPPLLVAALGPRMLALAAQRTSGAFAFLVTSDYVRAARVIVDEAAGAAGVAHRPVLVVTQPAVLGSGDAARRAARSAIERYLAQPNYRRNLARMGFTDAELADGGSDRLVDALVAQGDGGAIRSRIDEMFDAGADHVAVIPLSGEGRHADPEVTRALAPR